MILSCPECPKTYDVPPAALPPGGREVECSTCGCVWFERGAMARAAAVGAAGADVAYAGDFAYAEVIEAEFQAVGGTEPRPLPQTAPIGADPQPSPARAQQTALAVAYVPAVRPASDEAEAMRLLAAAATRRLRALRDAGLTALGFALGTTLHAAAKLRGRDAPRHPQTPGDAAARATRARMQARAANAMTPARALGWTAWTGTAASLAFVLTAKADAVREAFPPAANLYAMVATPPAPPGLRVRAELETYAVSSQGPAVMVAGVVVNAGAAEAVPQLTMTVATPQGPSAQAVALPAVALPPGGERPFAVRALVPEGATGVSLAVAPGDVVRDGFALQTQGPGWAEGHAGPPQLGRASAPAPR